MFQEPLNAEFALTQLEALCNDEDVWSSDSFNQYIGKSERGDYEESPSKYWPYFLDILASSNWQSVEEFFKFYESVGYELLNSLSEEDIPSLFGKDLDEYIVNLTDYGFKTLYKRAYEFMKDHPQMAKREITIPEFACDGGCDTNQPLISLIPCAIAYALPTFDDTWPLFQTLGNTPHTSFDEADIEYWCDIINYFGLRQIDITNGDFSGRIYQPKILKELFRMNFTGSIYSLITIKGFLNNDYTPPEIIAAIALAATYDYERLEDFDLEYVADDYERLVEDEFIDDICDWTLLEMAEEWDDDDRIHLCKGLFTDRGILNHPNCTEEIRNIIEDYLAKQEDE